MILLRFVSPFGPSWSQAIAPDNTSNSAARATLRVFRASTIDEISDPFFSSIALPFSKSRRPLTPGLKSKPMYNKGKLDPRPLAASQSYVPFFLAATAYPHALCTGLQSPAAIFLREKPAFETPEVRRELLTRSGRYSTNFTLPLGNARVTEALYQRPQAHSRST